MPKTMPASVTALKNQLSQGGAWVWLMTVTLPDSGGSLYYVNNTVDVVYDGQTYTAFNFRVSDFSWNTDGELPELTLRFANVGYVLQDYMRDYNGLIGGVLSFLYVNTDLLAVDYSEDEIAMTIVGAETLWPDVQITIGVPSCFRYRVPEDRLNPHACRHRFRATRCGYVGSAISAITLPSASVVVVDMAAAHGLATGAEVEIETSGITDLDGIYTITVTDSDSFTLDDTDGDDYSGSYTSGGLAGYAYCQRIPAECLERGQFPGNYGGPLCLRQEAVRYA